MTTKPKRKLDAYTLRWAAKLMSRIERGYLDDGEPDDRIRAGGAWFCAYRLLTKAREIEKEASRG